MRRFRYAISVVLSVGALLLATMAPASAQMAEKWVALGDSFIAGVGAGNYDPASGACLRSFDNIPQQLARQANRPVNLVDVTCSGAVVPSVRATQLSAVTPDTKLVLVGVGGNDAGFGLLAAQCVPLQAGVPDPDCSGAPSAAVIAGMPIVLRSVHKLLRDIHQQAPNARIVLLGYGQLLTKKATTVAGADPICTFLSPAERSSLYGVQVNLDLTLLVAALGVPNTSYVSPYAFPGLLRQGFVGRSLCETSDALYHGFDVLATGTPFELLHPKLAWGQQMTAVLSHS